MIVSISQPAYIPWLGYFQRIATSDLHIVLDHVQFERRSFTPRNKIKTQQGWSWLSVPTKQRGKFDQSILDVEIDNSTNWQERQWKTINHCYSKAPYFAEHKDFFESIFNRQWFRLIDLCNEITPYLLGTLGIRTPLKFSSKMTSAGAKDELILNLAQEAGATMYVSGTFGKDYLREELFDQAGIQVTYQDYKHPVYPQLWNQQFEPYMSVIDLLFNCGPTSLQILLSKQDGPESAAIISHAACKASF
jgi:hypothetical protein